MFSEKVVLIVDDDLLVRRALRRLLISFGFRDVLEASEGSEALAILGESPIDLVITDLIMGPPGMNGDEFCRQIREDSALIRIPVIMMTSAIPSFLSRAESRARFVGVTELLFNPVDESTLQKVIQRIFC